MDVTPAGDCEWGRGGGLPRQAALKIGLFCGGLWLDSDTFQSQSTLCEEAGRPGMGFLYEEA